MRKKEELEEELKSINDLIEKLAKRRDETCKDLDELSKQFVDFKVGDKIKTSWNEPGIVISTNGPDACPIIVLIHRYDVDRDDTGYFDKKGLLCGYNHSYTIEKY